MYIRFGALDVGIKYSGNRCMCGKMKGFLSCDLSQVKGVDGHYI